jgi:hypothetical protein
MREIFNSYTLTELKKLATSYNKKVKIAGVSKMKKPELINELLKHEKHFKDLKAKPKATPKKTTQKLKKNKEPEYSAELKKLLNEYFGKFIKLREEGKLTDKNEKELDKAYSDKLVRLLKKNNVDITKDSYWFRGNKGFKKTLQIVLLKFKKIEDLPNYKKI